MGDTRIKDFNYWQKLGKIGEHMFLEHMNCDFLKSNTDVDPTRPDIISCNGNLIEVKTCYSKRARRDRHGIQKYCIIHNRYSIEKPFMAQGNICGPWRAEIEGVRYFVKQYAEPFQCDIYDMNRLMPLLRTVIQTKRASGTLITKSRRVTTCFNEFFLIPRKDLHPALISLEEFVQNAMQ
jgi:hypothetical protein